MAMSLYAWVGLAVTIPAAIVLLVICVRSATHMPPREAAGQWVSLTASIVVFMLIELGNERLGLRDLPVVHLAIGGAAFVAGCALIYALVAGVTFLFRSGLRTLGAQLIVVALLTFWWLALVDLWN